MDNAAPAKPEPCDPDGDRRVRQAGGAFRSSFFGSLFLVEDRKAGRTGRRETRETKPPLHRAWPRIVRPAQPEPKRRRAKGRYAKAADPRGDARRDASQDRRSRAPKSAERQGRAPAAAPRQPGSAPATAAMSGAAPVVPAGTSTAAGRASAERSSSLNGSIAGPCPAILLCRNRITLRMQRAGQALSESCSRRSGRGSACTSCLSRTGRPRCGRPCPSSTDRSDCARRRASA